MSRKLLQRLSLIQWACFQNEVARMSGSTLFTGVNGSGKSTILDAVSYLLTANTSFNAAAKDRDRTVKGYVRGDTKSNGKDQFLRSGEVVSYLAGEFVSETDASTFVIGVCIESPGPADPCTSSWFIFRDTAQTADGKGKACKTVGLYGQGKGESPDHTCAGPAL